MFGMWNCTGKETEGGDYLELHRREDRKCGLFCFHCLLKVEDKIVLKVRGIYI